MRTRVGVVLTSTAALLAMLLAPDPSHADTRVPVFGDLPAGLTAVESACADGVPAGEPERATAGIAVGPATPPLHADSLTISASAQHVPGLAVDLPSSAGLATLQVAQYQGIHISVAVRLADGTWLPLRGAMGTGSVAGWRWFDAGDASTPDLGPVTAYLWFGGCGANEPVHVDALSVGPPGGVTTYDFEHGSTLLEGVAASWGVGMARRSVSCLLHAGLDPIPGETVAVESRPHGQGEFELLGTTETTASGTAAFVDHPHSATDYRCRYAGNDGTTGPPSPPLESQVTTLQVQTYVTIRARRTDHGTRVLATGAATPQHPGTAIAPARAARGRVLRGEPGRGTRPDRAGRRLPAVLRRSGRGRGRCGSPSPGRPATQGGRRSPAPCSSARSLLQVLDVAEAGLLRADAAVGHPGQRPQHDADARAGRRRSGTGSSRSQSRAHGPGEEERTRQAADERRSTAGALKASSGRRVAAQHHAGDVDHREDAEQQQRGRAGQGRDRPRCRLGT